MPNKNIKKNISQQSSRQVDVTCGGQDEGWLYTDIVKKHFFEPQNLLIDDEDYDADGIGSVGSPACGDMMTVWIKVDAEKNTIRECKWRTFGCASAIASTSMMSVMATENGGMDLDRAIRLKPQEIVERLGGLPDRKFHCSVLGQEALREAILDYRKNI
jgi:NifU-like protein involved in Fe-S cluster formation